MIDFSEIFGCVRDTKQSGNTFGKINAKGRSYISMLEKQLAECQATNGKLRWYLQGYCTKKYEPWAAEALAIPNDDTALNELIAEAENRTAEAICKKLISIGALGDGDFIESIRSGEWRKYK